jgi:hypothetical protein
MRSRREKQKSNLVASSLWLCRGKECSRNKRPAPNNGCPPIDQACQLMFVYYRAEESAESGARVGHQATQALYGCPRRFGAQLW